KEYVDKKGTVVYSEKYHKGTTGFCINRKFAEKHNVKSVFDLARP
ncbi:MAG: glycine/betaine ABC transporter substrate-binding protein, partial [Desulfuromonadales bacterium]|nr:glycine/betaine ABC transporter substrate-binding protein [Desulfuromonadales bacterium]NIS41547.1 glycine/betaine ABC transporter substrate-binding protein [Desulfuromonadales bacterium]